MSERYGKTVHFLSVYMREAHPLDGILPERQSGRWLFGTAERRLFIEDPVTFEERLALARHCQESMGLGFPMLVDDLGDTVNTAYAAWPERLYLIDIDGTIIYRSEMGPEGYRPDQLARVLERCAKEWAKGNTAGKAAQLRGKSKTKPSH
jgi:hypothetical protein